MNLDELNKLFELEYKHDKAYKGIDENNMLFTQRFGADPYVIVYDNRVYVYMTGDVVEYDDDGRVLNNRYGKINTFNVISSSDLINWTDHGSICAAGKDGAATWGNNSWAPAIAYKEVEGKMKFYLYFANGGNGIGVLSADSPIGPFVDPIGKALISRETPNCSSVAWLFDPAVLVDDDNRAYLYFGGGVPEGRIANPGTGRVVELSDDMIHIIGEPKALEIPYLFEDSGINKIGNTYYYSYCTNFNCDEVAKRDYGFENGQIAYMTSDNPMGPFSYKGMVLRNPSDYFGTSGNNHHCMFSWKNKMYIAYHTGVLGKELVNNQGYRSTYIDEVVVREDGSLIAKGTQRGVDAIPHINPFERVEAETIATMAGVVTIPCGEASEKYGIGNMAIDGIHTGSWTYIKGVDFGTRGANVIQLSAAVSQDAAGVIQIRINGLQGPIIGYVELQKATADYQEIKGELLSTITGKHDVAFLFYGKGYRIDYWYAE